MTGPNEALKELQRNAEIDFFTSEDGVRHLFIGTSKDREELRKKMEKEIRKALLKGLQITRKDGTKERLEILAIMDPSQEGSKQYQWDASRNRVRCSRAIHRTYKDGREEVEKLSDVWRDLWK